MTATAWAKFREWIAAQGGDLRFVDDPSRLPAAPMIAPLPAPRSGYVARADAREVGFTVVDLGGGRARKEDPVDPAVGVVLTKQGKIGGQGRDRRAAAVGSRPHPGDAGRRTGAPGRRLQLFG